LTSFQFLAQDLRQVISRPHTWHGLLGKLCLLPLNDCLAVIAEALGRVFAVVVVGHAHFFSIPDLSTPTNAFFVDDACAGSAASGVFTHDVSFIPSGG
jgi:hypothetical protein